MKLSHYPLAIIDGKQRSLIVVTDAQGHAWRLVVDAGMLVEVIEDRPMLGPVAPSQIPYQPRLGVLQGVPFNAPGAA